LEPSEILDSRVRGNDERKLLSVKPSPGAAWGANQFAETLRNNCNGVVLPLKREMLFPLVENMIGNL
jgi:hypothetical protein